MKYLLDTCILLWGLAGDKRFPDSLKEIINDPNNEIYYSSISVWEVELKHLKLENFQLSGEQFSFLCDQNYLNLLSIKNKHIFNLNNFQNRSHKDPFDKMLLAQADSENMILITQDKKFSLYPMKNIVIV